MRSSAAASASRGRSTRRSRSAPSLPASLLCQALALLPSLPAGPAAAPAQAPTARSSTSTSPSSSAAARSRLLVAKYQALAFFSDAMSFQIVRNLGGGSLVDALLYSLSEAGLMLIARPARRLFYVVAWLFLRGAGGATPLPCPILAARPGRRSRWRWRRRRCSCSRSTGSTTRARRSARFNGVIVVGTLLARRRPISTATAGASSPSRSTGSRSTAAAIPMRSTCPATASTRTAMAATSPSPARRRDRAAAGHRRPQAHVILIVLESTRADAIGRRRRTAGR